MNRIFRNNERDVHSRKIDAIENIIYVKQKLKSVKQEIECGMNTEENRILVREYTRQIEILKRNFRREFGEEPMLS